MAAACLANVGPDAAAASRLRWDWQYRRNPNNPDGAPLEYHVRLLEAYRDAKARILDINGEELIRHCVRLLIAVIPAAIAAWLISWVFTTQFDSTSMLALGLVIAGVVAVGLFVLLARLMARSGRRPGLALGYGLAVIGALLAMTGVMVRSFSLLLGGNATVTVCHSRTRDLGEVCRRAEILVAAAGQPRLVTGDMIRPGATVIDVGTNRTDEGLVGDVAFEEAKEVAGAITPVPGGVGPMTIAMLLVNTLSAARLRASTAATKTAAE